MNRAVIFLLGTVLLASCASTERKFSGTDRSRLFPDGVYRHYVRIRSADGKEYGFSGVVRISPEKIAVAGLGPMGTTVFTVIETRATGAVEAKIYQPAMAKHEDRIVAFFKALRTLLLQKSNAPKETQIPGPDGTVRVTVDEWDEHHIPSKFRMEHEKFTVSVQVEGYET